jgi:hypothetical protein
VETEQDEQIAQELGAHVEVLPVETSRRIAQLWATAEEEAKKREVSIGEATDPLVTLFQERVVLITGGDDLTKAGRSVRQLIATMTALAHGHGFNELHEVELNEALFKLHPLFPFTE